MNQKLDRFISEMLPGAGFVVLDPDTMLKLRPDLWNSVLVVAQDLRIPKSPFQKFKQRGLKMLLADVKGREVLIAAVSEKRLQERIEEVCGLAVGNLSPADHDPFEARKAPEPQRQQEWPPKSQVSKRMADRDPDRPDAPEWVKPGREIERRQREERLAADERQRQARMKKYEQHLAQQKALIEESERERKARTGA